MNMDKYTIPRYLDEPLKIAFLTIDEVLLLVVPILLGLFLFNAPIIGIAVGAILIVLLKIVKGEEGHYFIVHAAYWHLPSLIKFRSTLPSHMREILG